MIIAFKVILGLALLYLGGRALVQGAVALARRLGVSPLMIGLTVIAFGTSAPELVVCLVAALEGTPAITVGTVVGSNIANILLVLAAAALVRPIVRDLRSLRRDGLLAVAASLLFLALAFSGAVVAWQGAVMLVLLAAYLANSYWSDRRTVALEVEGGARRLEATSVPLWLTAARTVAGIAAVVAGSELLVSGAVGVARALGVSEAVIGITLVAVGTSLPEVATAVAAARQRHTDVALGNALGSNIFNILAIVGTVAVVTPLPIPAKIATFDVWIMVAVMAAFVSLAAVVPRIGRPLAAVFLLLYAAYVFAQFTGLSGVALS